MIDIIVILIVVVILAAAIGYIYKAKKSGKTCIGCPDSGSCAAAKKNGCGCGCGCDADKK